jgi:hypothetical protein
VSSDSVYIAPLDGAETYMSQILHDNDHGIVRVGERECFGAYC